MRFEKAQEAVDEIGTYISKQFLFALESKKLGGIPEQWAASITEIIDSYSRLITSLSTCADEKNATK